MPRKYQPVPGPSGYQKYAEESMQKALNDVMKGALSVRKAAEKWGVPKSTLDEHARKTRSGFSILKPGGQPVLSEDDERKLTEGLLQCAEWGYPLHASDVQDVVQTHLNSQGRVVKCFKENRPGEDWIWNFLRRNQNLTNRFAENIKQSRAAVDENAVKSYFDKLETTLGGQGVSPENMINFDETNFTDDPGSKRVLVRRGCRRPERIMDHTKSSISVMMAGTGDGQLLPPFVVYKALYLYPTWVEGGLPNSRYGCSKSGWFDMRLFEEWFVTVAVEYFRNKLGKKIMIGDNLASHFSPEVMRLCKLYDIDFIFFPPNSTHLFQPLDVAVFKSLKAGWRSTLADWKKKNRGVVQKSAFPALLRQTVESSGDRLRANIIAGFKATGLIPLNRQAVLKNLAGSETIRCPSWTKALTKKLEENRRSDTAPTSRGAGRGKRFNIQPGESVTAGRSSAPDEDNLQTMMGEDEGESGENMDSVSSCDDSDLQEEKIDDPEPVSEPAEGDFVLVNIVTEEDRRDKYYVGKIENVLDDMTYEVRFLRKKGGKKQLWFSYPDVPDIDAITPQSIVSKLKCEAMRRGKYTFPDIETIVNIKNVY